MLDERLLWLPELQLMVLIGVGHASDALAPYTQGVVRVLCMDYYRAMSSSMRYKRTCQRRSGGVQATQHKPRSPISVYQSGNAEL